MIKFEFELDDLDAQNLCGVLQTAISDASFQSYSAYSDYLKTQELIKLEEHQWFEAHQLYLQNLLDKIIAGQSQVEK